MSMILVAFASLTVGTLAWHLADVQMLRAFEEGRYTIGVSFMLLHIVSIPLFAFSSVTLFRVQRSWWIVEFPYYVIGLVVSALLFRAVLNVQITWREVLAGVLLLLVALLVTRK